MIFLLLFSFTAIEDVKANNLTFKEEDNLTFDLDQKISGTGYFTTYKHIMMPDALGMPGNQFNGVESASNSHGSGTIRTDSQIYAQSYHVYETYEDAEYDEEGNPYEEMEDADSIINLSEDSSMLYSPKSIAIGLRYYTYHPVIFNSLLKDVACIKNRDGLNSINHKVEEAHGLEKEINIQANYFSTMMKVEDNITVGHAHIGVLQLAGIPVDEEDEESDIEGEIELLGLAMKDWKKPQIELEEDYIGTFHMIKNISLITDSWLMEEEEAWLPCCTNGWEDILYYDQKGFGKSTRGVFDCTCINVPSRAQFPR